MNTNEQMNKNRRTANKEQREERGYALVGLMVVMMFMLILTTAAAPTLRLEMQREKEEEMFWRGQQIAIAIERFRAFRGGAFPTSLEELVEGVDVGVKRLHLLRPSAICDPMTLCEGGETNWRLVNPGDPLAKELLEAIIIFQEKSQTPINPQGIQELARFAQLGSVTLPGQSDTQLDGVNTTAENQEGGAASGEGTQGAMIIGVVSKKSGKMFRNYYGIEEYDHALFFPKVPVVAGGLTNPFITPGGAGGRAIPGGVPGGVPDGVPGGGAAAPRDPRCPAGGVFINGRCQPIR
jgi:type II secretory pathway pseudopilin PulG